MSIKVDQFFIQNSSDRYGTKKEMSADKRSFLLLNYEDTWALKKREKR